MIMVRLRGNWKPLDLAKHIVLKGIPIHLIECQNTLTALAFVRCKRTGIELSIPLHPIKHPLVLRILQKCRADSCQTRHRNQQDGFNQAFTIISEISMDMSELGLSVFVVGRGQ